ncbi:MAG: nucleoside recognition protein [Christensenellales bacterium]
MNTVYVVMMIASLLLVTITAPESALSIMLGGAKSAIGLSVSLCAIYTVWLSVLQIIDKTGMGKTLSKAFKPLTKKLFRGESDLALEYITLNFSANLLGMGGAATPLGIKAMEYMQDGSDKASDNMILFMVINATSIQLLPATIIGLRASKGSASASDIILPSLIATTFSTLIGVILCKVLCSKKAEKKEETLPLKDKL